MEKAWEKYRILVDLAVKHPSLAELRTVQADAAVALLASMDDRDEASQP
jgi:hypothetical protein